MKVAIATHYFKSKNYGANLQAYAMCKVIEKYGYTAEQLCFPQKWRKLTEYPSVQKKKPSIKDLQIAFHVFVFNFLIFSRRCKAATMVRRREESMLAFNQNLIPHSQVCYTESHIENALSEYDVFLTGSDMVWCPDLFSRFFALDFVPNTVPKFSYAASMGVTSLRDNECEIFREFLKNYQGVSVRERNTVSLLDGISPVPVEWVMDPTLILEPTGWDDVCSGRIIDQPYLFCYFLGEKIDSRKAAREYAEKNQLKLVTIPYLRGEYRSCDWKFGDIQLSDVSPADFISLIRHSKAVFTDSFHACVFSFLYQRDMFAFRRNAGDKWGSRIQSFLELIGCSQRYCDTDEKEHLEYIESIPSIDYSAPFTDFEVQKKKSLDYLERNLKLAEETIQKNAKKD